MQRMPPCLTALQLPECLTKWDQCHRLQWIMLKMVCQMCQMPRIGTFDFWKKNSMEESRKHLANLAEMHFRKHIVEGERVFPDELV